MKKLLFTALLALSACGPAAESIKDSAPTGTFNGKSWTYAKSVVYVDGDDLDVNLYSDASIEDCDKFASSKDAIFWSQKKKEGETRLKLAFDGTGQTVTFYDGDTNYILTEGLIKISALSDTSVTIGLVAGNGDDAVNGTVTASICQ